ncbi:MAG: apolipoprotein N-acyltransferase [Saprospiraceae bacterium]|nr:apolipoprotein N-acyltransferase [Candidatus Vicinibacter affinis]MBP6172016.1 apolipoprotein N-acyltransferase [Saprospiraceae bacterium]
MFGIKHWYYPLLFGFIFIVAFSGWKMYSLPLWGHLPLLFFSALWGIIVLGFYKFKSNKFEFPKLILGSTISGLLFALSFPPFGLTPLLFIAWVPLLYINDSSIINDKFNKLNLFFPYHAFVIWNILTTYWVANAALIPGMVAIWLNSFFMLIPWWGAVKLSHNKKSINFWALIFFWMTFEWVHLNWEISWPWLTLGNAFASWPSWIQWYEYTGVFGGTLWVLLTNIIFYKIFSVFIKFGRHTLLTNNKKLLWSFFLLVFIPILISYCVFFTYKTTGVPVEIGIVQPNLEPHYEKFNVPEYLQLKKFRKLAKEAVSPTTQYLIFPETSFGDPPGNIFRRNEMSSDSRIQDWQNFISNYENLSIVMGITSMKIIEKNEEITKFSRPFRNLSEPRFYELENSAIQICKEDPNFQLYRKSKLVPGAEIFPYRKFLPFLKPLVDQLGGSPAGLATQKNRAVISTNNFKIAPVICYESIYGDYMRGYMKNGAQAIFIMTNDGWWDNTPGYKQHLAFGALRAIEFRKPIARSANTGISCFIDIKGIIHQPTKYGQDAAIRGVCNFNNKVTIYCLIGDALAYLAMIASLVLIVLSVLTRKR